MVQLLMILRDLGLPMPAGATLISPWVDLAHSFPSVGGDGACRLSLGHHHAVSHVHACVRERVLTFGAFAGAGDYIPANGFIYRPDITFPPPPDPRNAIEQVLVGEEEMVRDGMDIKIRLEEQVQVRHGDWC